MLSCGSEITDQENDTEQPPDSTTTENVIESHCCSKKTTPVSCEEDGCVCRPDKGGDDELCFFL